jgi:3,4-dihydroxy 2-butanone 4-phosphate synthase/GTP cyclohydrolase II
VTTGISAADRATTILAAVAPDAGPEDIVSPGHVFPLRAAPGGVLQRTGQTEGSVDLARLAGLEPAGVICEVMKDDGTMARMPDLEAFAREHGLAVISVADLIQYRLQVDQLVRRAGETKIRVSRDGLDLEVVMIAYEPVPGVGEGQYLALVHGDPSATADPVLCRVHTGSVVEDVFGVATRRHAVPILNALRLIAKEECGVLLYLPGRIGVADEVGLHACTDAPMPLAARPGHLREFGLGAQILRDLGVRKIRLLTNTPRKIVGLRAYGLEIADHTPLVDPT